MLSNRLRIGPFEGPATVKPPALPEDIYFLTLVTAGLVVLIPGAPLVLITLFVQVVAVTLLPAALVFLILLLNDRRTMGEYSNTTTQNVICGAIVAVIIVLSTLYAISTLFPSLFG